MPVTTNTRKLAALLGASGAGIATDGTLTSTAIGEVIVAGDIAAGAVGESEMAASLIGVNLIFNLASCILLLLVNCLMVQQHILVHMELHKQMDLVITTQTSKEASQSKILELVLILGARGISVSQCNY